MEISRRIRDARKKAGLTQKELGERAGMSESMIGQYEIGYRNPKFSTLERISEALGMTVESFLDFENNTEAREMDVFDRIESWLKDNHVSRRKLALMAGLPPSSLQSTLTRRKNISSDMLDALSKTMKVSLDYLVCGTADKARSPYIFSIHLPGYDCVEIRVQAENQGAAITKVKALIPNLCFISVVDE